jgi:hypothetical protein
MAGGPAFKLQKPPQPSSSPACSMRTPNGLRPALGNLGTEIWDGRTFPYVFSLG